MMRSLLHKISAALAIVRSSTLWVHVPDDNSFVLARPSLEVGLYVVIGGQVASFYQRDERIVAQFYQS